MSESAPGRAQYLESLSRLHRSWAHETRSHLGNVSLQLELLQEHVNRGNVADGEKLRAPLERARQGVARLERCLDRYLGAAVPRGPRSDPAGLSALLAELRDLVEPFARERQVKWSVTGEAGASIPDAATETVRESLATVAIGTVAEAPAAASVEVRAERAGADVTVRVTRPADAPAPAWLEPARAALEGAGGGLRTMAGAAPGVELRIPVTPEAR